LLVKIGPRRLTENVLSLIHPRLDDFGIHPEPDDVGRPPITDQWEVMPATTRVKVEGMVQTIPSRSLVRWLDDVAGLLHQERPTRSREFSSRASLRSGELGLNAGIAYNFFLHPDGRGGRVESRFQRYCRVALTAVGDTRTISARQVANYKGKYSKGN
jgi:hypothetical protein